jgi:hypothetical protein
MTLRNAGRIMKVIARCKALQDSLVVVAPPQVSLEHHFAPSGHEEHTRLCEEYWDNCLSPLT